MQAGGWQRIALDPNAMAVCAELDVESDWEPECDPHSPKPDTKLQERLEYSLTLY